MNLQIFVSQKIICIQENFGFCIKFLCCGCMEYMIDRDFCLMIFQENDKRKNKMKGGCEWINKIGEIKIKKNKK